MTPEEDQLFQRLIVLWKKWHTLKMSYALRRVIAEADLVQERLEKLGWSTDDILEVLKSSERNDTW